MKPSDVLRESKRVIGTLREMSYSDVSAKLSDGEKAVVVIYFVPFAHPFLDEYVYSPTSEEWPVFQKDASTMCKSDPEIHVVDAKWRIPI